MSITRISLIFTMISMLSGCCCLWYVDVDEPEVYSKQKRQAKDRSVQSPIAKEKDTTEETK
jgi:hypothetical protein